jgi:hypothetical protein
MKQLMVAHPEQFVVDSDNGRGFVGLTHSPTSFQVHVPKGLASLLSAPR